MKIAYDLITILGHTAGGKTRFGSVLANKIGAEIISADSRQLYRGMDIGTGKDIADYTVDGVTVPYHLIDIKEAGYKYNVFEYQKDFNEAYKQIKERNKPVILCGGTGMYIEAVVKGYNLPEVAPDIQLREALEKKETPELIAQLESYKKLHNSTDLSSRKRIIRAIEIEEYIKSHPYTINDYPPINNIYIGLNYEREIRRNRISKRLDERLKEGMIEEVEQLMKNGLSLEDLLFYGLEYKFVGLYLTGKLQYNEMHQQLEIAIHQFAKRQMTWFRGMERKGALIHWLNGEDNFADNIDKAISLINNPPIFNNITK